VGYLSYYPCLRQSLGQGLIIKKFRKCTGFISQWICCFFELVFWVKAGNFYKIIWDYNVYKIATTIHSNKIRTQFYNTWNNLQLFQVLTQLNFMFVLCNQWFSSYTLNHFFKHTFDLKTVTLFNDECLMDSLKTILIIFFSFTSINSKFRRY